MLDPPSSTACPDWPLCSDGGCRFRSPPQSSTQRVPIGRWVSKLAGVGLGPRPSLQHSVSRLAAVLGAGGCRFRSPPQSSTQRVPIGRWVSKLAGVGSPALQHHVSRLAVVLGAGGCRFRAPALQHHVSRLAVVLGAGGAPPPGVLVVSGNTERGWLPRETPRSDEGDRKADCFFGLNVRAPMVFRGLNVRAPMVFRGAPGLAPFFIFFPIGTCECLGFSRVIYNEPPPTP
jgi:hypothetical protein